VGLTICVEGESGDRIDFVEDSRNLLHHLLPSPDDAMFRLVNYVDWHGNTVFNVLQIPTVVRELEVLLGNARTPEDRDLLSRVIALAQQCLEDVHLYLKFYGD
jgi:hypothetical protein